MTKTVLSVNLNKIALLRNSRGRDFPSVVDFAKKTIELGVKGITIHPRPDERHIRRQDARDLALLIKNHQDVELNIEGYPSDEFITLIKETKPHQVTLVPDGEQQITSDHGWDIVSDLSLLEEKSTLLRPYTDRLAMFVDAGIDLAPLTPLCDRVELYTEAYAQAYVQSQSSSDTDGLAQILSLYQTSAQQARSLNIGLNAGHDLDLNNLGEFLLQVPGIQEVSIGHALTVEALQMGWANTIQRYLDICR